MVIRRDQVQNRSPRNFQDFFPSEFEPAEPGQVSVPQTEQKTSM
jgi:hypothetical protein